MRIVLHNIDPADGAVAIPGPHVPVVLCDAGEAQVTVVLALSNGMQFCFPDPAGRAWPQTVVLPPGEHACSVLVAAVQQGRFGRRYDSGVVIAGKLVAAAEGEIAAGDDADIARCAFTLRVA
ncbi:MAG TPA: hypothetical protein VF169_23785 [Albitalea sp.]|uniref:hypothetical protein n=1 Tax=Piscinibacter sp. TaxID=1903157 RepID=UPI002ED48691